MTPILFDKTANTFTTNGIGRLVDCISCTVTEERNGIYECEFEYPINGKWYHEMITNGGIIGVIHDDNHDIQPFDIYKSEAPIEGVVTFYAHHISYRLNNIILKPFTASSASAAIAAISSNSVNTNPFTFSTDKVVSGQFTLSHPENVRSVLFGKEGSILDVYGTAEFKFDKFNVQMLQHRGTDTGVTVRYGKNMTGLEQTIDESGTYNAIAPYWTDGTNYVYSNPIIVQPSTAITPVKPVALDISDKFTQQPTAAEVETMARSLLDSDHPWIIDKNIKVDFIAMWQTPEYENVASIQRVGLCDTVSVYYTDMGIVAEKEKVVRVVYDVLAERLNEIELGQLPTSFVAIDNGIQTGEQYNPTPKWVSFTLTNSYNATYINTNTAATYMNAEKCEELKLIHIYGGMETKTALSAYQNNSFVEINSAYRPDKNIGFTIFNKNQNRLHDCYLGADGIIRFCDVTAIGGPIQFTYDIFYKYQ